MKTEKPPIELYTASLSELAAHKIWVEIKPVDCWTEWNYKIYLEDSMSPFFEAHHANGFRTHEAAKFAAIDWLEANQIIVITDELPF